MKPSILCVTLEYPPRIGGIATYLSRYLESIPDAHIAVLAPDDVDHDADMHSGILVYRRPLEYSRIRPRWLPAVFAIWHTIRKERPSFVLISHILPIGVIVRWFCRLLRIPYGVIIHGMDIATASATGGWKRRQAMAVLRDASCIIANSAYTTTWLPALGIPANRAVIIPPPASYLSSPALSSVDVSAFRKRHNIPSQIPLICSVGRLVRRKGFDTAIYAISELIQSGIAVRYMIVGDGPDRERLESLVDSCGIRGSVLFCGSLSSDELSLAYAASDIFIMLARAEGSDVEGFGIVYLDAALHGLPAIASRTGGVSEAVLHNETGILIPPDSVSDAVHALRTLIADSELRDRLGAAGRRRVSALWGSGMYERQFSVTIRRILLGDNE